MLPSTEKIFDPDKFDFAGLRYPSVLFGFSMSEVKDILTDNEIR